VKALAWNECVLCMRCCCPIGLAAMLAAMLAACLSAQSEIVTITGAGCARQGGKGRYGSNGL
jgi:hypothetical protein